MVEEGKKSTEMFDGTDLPPRLVGVSGIFKDYEFLLVQERIIIGRGKDCDLVLKDSTVSRKHAELSRIGEDFYVSDLGSRNGVLVNGIRVKKKLLSNGDMLTLGEVSFRFESTQEKPEKVAKTVFDDSFSSLPISEWSYSVEEKELIETSEEVIKSEIEDEETEKSEAFFSEKIVQEREEPSRVVSSPVIEEAPKKGKRKLSSRKKFYMVIAIVFVVSIAGILLLNMSLKNQKKSTKVSSISPVPKSTKQNELPLPVMTPKTPEVSKNKTEVVPLVNEPSAVTKDAIEKANEHYQKGIIYYESQRYKLAIKEWEKALELYPQHRRARAILDRVTKELRENYLKHINRAKLLSEQGLYRQAINEFSIARLYITDPNSLEAKQIEESIQALKQRIGETNY